MRRAALVAALLVAPRVAPRVAPLGAQPGGARPGEARVVRGPLTAALRVTPASVARGGAYTVRFALRNTSRRPVVLTLGCTAPATLALRRDARGDGETLDGSTCAQAITTRTLAADAEVELTQAWRAESLGASPPAPLAAGRYVVEATPTLSEVDGKRLTLSPLRVALRVR